jgi:hypothetical protein
MAEPEADGRIRLDSSTFSWPLGPHLWLVQPLPSSSVVASWTIACARARMTGRRVLSPLGGPTPSSDSPRRCLTEKILDSTAPGATECAVGCGTAGGAGPPKRATHRDRKDRAEHMLAMARCCIPRRTWEWQHWRPGGPGVPPGWSRADGGVDLVGRSARPTAGIPPRGDERVPWRSLCHLAPTDGGFTPTGTLPRVLCKR